MSSWIAPDEQNEKFNLPSDDYLSDDDMPPLELIPKCGRCVRDKNIVYRCEKCDSFENVMNRLQYLRAQAVMSEKIDTALTAPNRGILEEKVQGIANEICDHVAKETTEDIQKRWDEIQKRWKEKKKETEE